MCLKVSIVLSMALVMASATYGGHGGHSNSFRKQDDHGNYAFGYDIVDHKGAKNFRKESGDGHGNKHGSYGLHDIDGRLRIVDYVADGHGFRAKIRTNEPGTASKDAAHATYNGPDHHGYGSSHIPSGKVHHSGPSHGSYGGGYGGGYAGGYGGGRGGGPVAYASQGYGVYAPSLGGHAAYAPAYGGWDGPVGAYSHSSPVFAPYFGY